MIKKIKEPTGRTAWVTGGTRGIGFGIAKSLAELGYSLAVNGIRTASEVSDLERLKNDYGVDLLYCQGNIGIEADRQRMVKSFLDHFGSIEILVNNAGVAPRIRMDILEVTEEEYDYVMDINLKGTFFLSQMVANHMLAQAHLESESTFRCIINVSSISATIASINRPQYCLSKAGMSMLTQLLAVRLGEHGIPVYEVRPGIIKTDMTAAVTAKYDALIREGLCVTSRWGTPEDVGRAVGVLVRGDLPYSTGQVIMVDGGLTIQKL
ncbi:MAG TPA: 3-ketoacyl-ACP reductase [Saprospiraceae bacterium]|nr:3-ketoacyl-ACP reductase [Saprospiraceae bacterium]HPQ98717.1 3-ketoacyl-ACP reductase [Saprospiraceae bacterium]HQU52438.1 3-ketoacyl-ACP reductase [Saprospiraceae bacterium]HRV84137.1 3-ketoacyl-ACP reductase [Saprospiraceae bacterium]